MMKKKNCLTQLPWVKCVVSIDQQQVELVVNKFHFRCERNEQLVETIDASTISTETNQPLYVLKWLCSDCILLRSQPNTNIMFPYSKMTAENNSNQLIFFRNITREAGISCNRDNVQSYISVKMLRSDKTFKFSDKIWSFSTEILVADTRFDYRIWDARYVKMKRSHRNFKSSFTPTILSHLNFVLHNFHNLFQIFLFAAANCLNTLYRLWQQSDLYEE
jgi:hypothetical protein